MKQDITELFVFLDDFCKQYELILKTNILPSSRKITRIPGLQISEIMSVLLLFQKSPAKNFKFFYQSYLQLYKSEFPNLPSYNRFIELQQRCLGHFHAFTNDFMFHGKTNRSCIRRLNLHPGLP